MLRRAGNPGIELSSEQGAATAMPLALAGPHVHLYRRRPSGLSGCKSGIAPACSHPGSWLLTSGHDQVVAALAMCTMCMIYWGSRRVLGSFGAAVRMGAGNRWEFLRRR